MILKLLTLELRNFKGIKEFKLEAQGKNVNIYGDNATGKTTIFDAFTWLLFDKDHENKKDFNIKPLDKNGEAVHGLETEVKATLQIDNQQITLKKVFYEKWVKQKGSAEKVFTGHSTDYFINDVPVKKSEYEEKIKSFVDEKIFKLLTNPLYFNEQLHWQERRKILLDMCGDVSDEEIIANDIQFCGLKKVLEQNRTIEEQKKILLAKKKEINEQLEKIPVRIDEINRTMIADADGLDVKEICRVLADKKALLSFLKEEKVKAEAGGLIAEKQKLIAEIDQQILKMKNDNEATKQKLLFSYQEKLNKLLDKHNKIALEIKYKLIEKEKLQNEIESLNKEIEQLREEWRRVNAEKFEASNVCPTCGQTITEDRIQQAIDEFNLAKAQKLEEISTKGKERKAKVVELQEQIKNIEEEVRNLASQDEEIKTKTREIQQQIGIVKTKESDMFLATIQEFTKEKERLQKEIEKLKANNQEALKQYDIKIQEAEKEIEKLQQRLLKVQQIESAKQRIEELKQEERRLAAEYEQVEKEIYVIEEFTRAKVKLLTDRINSKFKMAKFKLFDIQINGGIQECCETTYLGVPYPDLNNAAKINVGLDIINTLSEYYNFSAPIFIDNRESVTKLIDTKAQLISLIVSEKDKKLRVEVDKDE